MYRYLSCLLLLPGLLLSACYAQTSAGKWHNQEVQQPLSVQTRFDFSLEHLTGGLLIQRYPPLCRNAELAFEAGPASFAPSLAGQPVVVRFKVDYLPSRQALFSSHLQHKEDGPYLVLKMVSMERASTLLAEMAQGMRMTISFDSDFSPHTRVVSLAESNSALLDAVEICAAQAIQIE